MANTFSKEDDLPRTPWHYASNVKPARTGWYETAPNLPLDPPIQRWHYDADADRWRDATDKIVQPFHVANYHWRGILHIGSDGPFKKKPAGSMWYRINGWDVKPIGRMSVPDAIDWEGKFGAVLLTVAGLNLLRSRIKCVLQTAEAKKDLKS